jgi:hypothetical protein
MSRHSRAWRSASSPRDRQRSRIVFGLIVIGVGLLALLDNLNLFDIRVVRPYWPLVFVLLGALKLQQTRHAGGVLAAAVLIALGAGMTLHNLGYLQLHLRDWWPVFVIAGGLLLVAKGLRPQSDADDPDPAGAEGVLPQHGSRLNAAALFSGNVLQNDSQQFAGGELTAIMGAVQCDLRQASISGTAVLRVFVVMGGIELKVPTDWSVVVNGLPLLGGIDDKSVPPMNTAKRLVIEGYVILGGLEVKN